MSNPTINTTRLERLLRLLRTVADEVDRELKLMDSLPVASSKKHTRIQKHELRLTTNKYNKHV